MTVEAVDAALDEVRPFLIADGGNVEVASVSDGVVYLRLQVRTDVAFLPPASYLVHWHARGCFHNQALSTLRRHHCSASVLVASAKGVSTLWTVCCVTLYAKL